MVFFGKDQTDENIKSNVIVDEYPSKFSTSISFASFTLLVSSHLNRDFVYSGPSMFYVREGCIFST